MKGPITCILLPMTFDEHFAGAAEMALQMAKASGAHITLLTVDDDSAPYETTSLPFHDGAFIAKVEPGENFPGDRFGDRAANFLCDAGERNVGVERLHVRGHTATQILLVSRFHDFVVSSGQSEFTEGDRKAMQRVKPLVEILDQSVVPLLMVGTGGGNVLRSAAILFDGGPCATLALHGLAAMLTDRPDIPIHVRVSLIEEKIAQRLADDCEAFLSSKGYLNVAKEYSPLAPMEALAAGDFPPVDLTALGIRSRNTFHDLHVGVLARHLIEVPQPGHTLLC